MRADAVDNGRHPWRSWLSETPRALNGLDSLVTNAEVSPKHETVSSEGHPRGNGDGPLTIRRSTETKEAYSVCL